MDHRASHTIIYPNTESDVALHSEPRAGKSLFDGVDIC